MLIPNCVFLVSVLLFELKELYESYEITGVICPTRPGHENIVSNKDSMYFSMIFVKLNFVGQ